MGTRLLEKLVGSKKNLWNQVESILTLITRIVKAETETMTNLFQNTVMSGGEAR